MLASLHEKKKMDPGRDREFRIARYKREKATLALIKVL